MEKYEEKGSNFRWFFLLDSASAATAAGRTTQNNVRFPMVFKLGKVKGKKRNRREREKFNGCNETTNWQSQNRVTVTGLRHWKQHLASLSVPLTVALPGPPHCLVCIGQKVQSLYSSVWLSRGAIYAILHPTDVQSRCRAVRRHCRRRHIQAHTHRIYPQSLLALANRLKS